MPGEGKRSGRRVVQRGCSLAAFSKWISAALRDTMSVVGRFRRVLIQAYYLERQYISTSVGIIFRKTVVKLLFGLSLNTRIPGHGPSSSGIPFSETTPILQRRLDLPRSFNGRVIRVEGADPGGRSCQVKCLWRAGKLISQPFGGRVQPTRNCRLGRIWP